MLAKTPVHNSPGQRKWWWEFHIKSGELQCPPVVELPSELKCPRFINIAGGYSAYKKKDWQSKHVWSVLAASLYFFYGALVHQPGYRFTGWRAFITISVEHAFATKFQCNYSQEVSCSHTNSLYGDRDEKRFILAATVAGRPSWCGSARNLVPKSAAISNMH